MRSGRKLDFPSVALGNAYLTALGTDSTAHMGAISSVSISEHEDVIRAGSILGSRLHQFYGGSYAKYFFVVVLLLESYVRRPSLHQHRRLTHQPFLRTSSIRPRQPKENLIRRFRYR